MLDKHSTIVKELRTNDKHFNALWIKHDQLNKLIDKKDIPNDFDIEKLKKEKLQLKDKIYAQVLKKVC